MELNGIIDYDHLYVLQLLHPVTEKPLGIMFQIRSESSDEARQLQRRHTTDNVDRRLKGKAISPGVLERQAAESAAVLIASWDWGEHTWNGEKPELSMEKAVEIVGKEDWIFAQVMEASADMENFSRKSARPSVSASKSTSDTA